jgi:hypothetical protein
MKVIKQFKGMLCASCFVEKLYLLTHGKSIFIIPVSLKDEQKLYDKIFRL